ncbi:unnamed protein product, partial [Pneumocystis jirovecii]
EYGTASNIKSRVNRLSVLGAITSTREKLKLYNKVPPNGLVIYCGEIITDDGKEKKLSIDFEPFKPINTSLYLCDNKFHTEALSELLESDQKFGFIVMDGNGSLFGTLSGNTREVLYKFTVDLPKKHVRKVAEMAVQLFITNDKVNVAGLILAGSADTVIVHLTKEQSEKNRELFIDKETKNEMEIASSISLLEWLTEKYKEFGANLEFVTDKSQEGNQFCKGFSGIGGLLRYK